MDRVEKIQALNYLHPLFKVKPNNMYLDKMRFLTKELLEQGIVFSSTQKCYTELFLSILITLKSAPSYQVIDSYKLIDIDNKTLKDEYQGLYSLAKPDVLFIKCGTSDKGLSDKLKLYIGNCIDVLAEERYFKGLRTYIFNYGSKKDFLEYQSSFQWKFVNINFESKEEI